MEKGLSGVGGGVGVGGRGWGWGRWAMPRESLSMIITLHIPSAFSILSPPGSYWDLNMPFKFKGFIARDGGNIWNESVSIACYPTENTFLLIINCID